MLEARHFTIFTDHKPLTFAFKQKRDMCSPRQFQHLDFIAQFTTDIRHISGQDNVVADALALIQLQKQLKGVAKQNFEFRSTRNGTKVVTKGMLDYRAVKTIFNNHSLSYYTFHTKADKPTKAVIRHIPINTTAEDIAEGLEDMV
jgi:hypothetical protein